MNMNFAVNPLNGDWIIPSFHGDIERMKTFVATLNYNAAESDRAETEVWILRNHHVSHPGIYQLRTVMDILTETIISSYKADPAGFLKDNSAQLGEVETQFAQQASVHPAVATGKLSPEKIAEIERHKREVQTMQSGAGTVSPVVGENPRDQARINEANRKLHEESLKVMEQQKAEGERLAKAADANVKTKVLEENNAALKQAQAVADDIERKRSDGNPSTNPEQKDFNKIEEKAEVIAEGNAILTGENSTAESQANCENLAIDPAAREETQVVQSNGTETVQERIARIKAERAAASTTETKPE